MPVYEYKCEKCGIIEVWQNIKDAELEKCPNLIPDTGDEPVYCNGKVRKLMSAGVFYFNHHLKH